VFVGVGLDTTSGGVAVIVVLDAVVEGDDTDAVYVPA
jgi:hypothetical protein